MTEKTGAPAAEKTGTTTRTATADQQPDQQAALATAQTAGATAAKDRIKSILGAKEAKGREQLAQHLAFNTDMAVADAVATLEASPKVDGKVSAASGTALDSLMKDHQPKVETGESTGSDHKAQLGAAVKAMVEKNFPGAVKH